MWRITAQLDNAILAEHTVRDSFYQRGGVMRTDSEERADTVGVQGSDFFTALLNKTVLFEIDDAPFDGWHGVRYGSTDYLLAFDLGTGYLRLFFDGTSPYYIDILDTETYTPIAFVQGPSATSELFFIGYCGVNEG